MEEKCNYCNGEGYTIEADHDPNCDGSCRNCPIAVQVECKYCDGTGYIFVKKQEEKEEK